MEIITIKNYTKITMDEVLNVVTGIVRIGRITETKDGPTFCPVMKFENGVTIFCERSKKNDTFRVFEE